MTSLDLQKYAVAIAVALLVAGCGSTEIASDEPSASRPAISEYLPSPAVLVFSATRGWHHDSGIAGADHFFAELASERGWGVFTTAHPGVFNADDLARFDVIVFNNVTGNVLGTAQQRAFETWMTRGGAWIGLHGAGDSSILNWPWYQHNLVGTTFIGHTMAPQVPGRRPCGSCTGTRRDGRRAEAMDALRRVVQL